MNILNMVIPIQMLFCQIFAVSQNWSDGAGMHPTKCDVLMTSNYFQQYIVGKLLQISNVIQSDVILNEQAHKN